jgi:hypothetical protein
MNEKTIDSLPMIGSHPMDEDTASCAPKVYVSNEEKSILDAMRELRDRAVELRAKLEDADAAEERPAIESELAELRHRRTDLAGRREKAFKRKMIMLGHIPPDDEIRLF